MKSLKELIDKITEFGITPNAEVDDKINVLKSLLANIYVEYLKVSFEFDDREYADLPNIDYYKILENVKANFPNFGWYSTVIDSNRMEPNVKLGIGDELDDLSDIIKDLLSVKWRMENTSMNDAIWHFEFLMRTHSEMHLLNLLKRLKERED